jgi:hypothetical protein
MTELTDSADFSVKVTFSPNFSAGKERFLGKCLAIRPNSDAAAPPDCTHDLLRHPLSNHLLSYTQNIVAARYDSKCCMLLERRGLTLLSLTADEGVRGHLPLHFDSRWIGTPPGVATGARG